MDKQKLIESLTKKQKFLKQQEGKLAGGSRVQLRNVQNRLRAVNNIISDINDGHPFHIREGFVSTTSAKVQL